VRTPAGYHNRWRVATPLPPDRTISFEITPEVAQSGDHVANHDAEDDEVLRMMRIKNRLWVMYKNPLQLEEHVSPIGSLLT